MTQSCRGTAKSKPVCCHIDLHVAELFITAPELLSDAVNSSLFRFACSLQTLGLHVTNHSSFFNCGPSVILNRAYCMRCITILIAGKQIILLNCFPPHWFLLTFKPPPLSYISANLFSTTLAFASPASSPLCYNAV